ncbi:MAG: hypothetical protein SNJ77_06765 [Cytophagales bacterium]
MINLTKILVIIIPSLLFSQHEFWVGAGTEYGMPVGGSYQNNKKVLYSRYSMLTSGALFFQYRVAQRIGIDFGASQMFSYHHFRERRFREEHENRFDANMKLSNFFTSLQASLQYRQPIEGSYAGLYMSLGYKANQVGRGSVTESRFFQPDNTNLTFNASYKGNYNSIFGEIGTQILTDDESNLITCALRYEFGLTDMFEGNLNVEQANQFYYSDRISWSGNYIGIVFKYHFRALEFKARKSVQRDPSVINNNPNTYVVRTTVVKQTIEVKTKKVKVTIVEQYREDNDIVSAQLNGRWVLKNHKVTKKPYTFEVELYPGRNELVFVAENLGDIPPNTATIFVEDAGKKYKVDFVGTLEKNESIIINYQP